MTITANSSMRLASLLGDPCVLSSEFDLRKYAIEGCTPAVIVKPRDAQEVAEVVGFASAEKLAVVCCGARTKLEIGMPPRRYDVALDLSSLTEIAHYDPADLTLSVDAGLPLASLSKVLAAMGQFLPLSVPCFDTSTVGGTIATGSDSMLRLQYGASRDFLIGAEFVDGKGQLCKSGGRVVKNVTGYDIHKLLIGSFGTLAAITRLNFRTFPLPEAGAGFLAGFSKLETALSFRKNLFDSGLPFANVELFDPEFATRLGGTLKERNNPVADLLTPPHWFVYAAFSGNEAVVRRMKKESKDRANRFRATTGEILDRPSNEPVSEALREAFAWLRASGPNPVLLRLVPQQCTPADLSDLLKESLSPSQRSALLLSGSGICLLATFCEADSASDREALEQRIAGLFSHGGRKAPAATLLHVPAWLKARCGTWGPVSQDFSLMQRVKSAFDPQGIFSPGRFVGGI
jgi:glycolate oxidase FAD binding subunit